MPDPIEVELNRLAKPIQKLYDQAEAEHEELKAKLQRNQERRTRLSKALRAIDPEFAPGQAKPKKKKADAQRRVSDQMLSLVTTAIMDGAETIPEIAETTGKSAGAVRDTVIALRGEEIIRKAGKRGRADTYKPFRPLTAAEPVTTNG